MSMCSRHESYLAKAASMPDAEDQSMMGRFVRVERQVRTPITPLTHRITLRHVGLL